MRRYQWPKVVEPSLILVRSPLKKLPSREGNCVNVARKIRGRTKISLESKLKRLRRYHHFRVRAFLAVIFSLQQRKNQRVLHALSHQVVLSQLSFEHETGIA